MSDKKSFRGVSMSRNSLTSGGNRNLYTAGMNSRGTRAQVADLNPKLQRENVDVSKFFR